MTYQPQWSPPPGDSNYPPPPPPPRQPGIGWLWLVIVALVALAVVRMNWTLPPSVLPTAPATTHPAPTAPVVPPTPEPSGAVPTGGFCTTYYVFSIDVNASWAGYSAAVTKGDDAGASALVAEFYAKAQAMQQAGPPAAVTQQVDTVVSVLQAAQLPPDSIWADIAALQTAAGPICG